MINEEKNIKIEELVGQGLSYSKIAETLDISKGYISKLMSGNVSAREDLNGKSFTNRSQTVHEEINDIKAEILSDILPKIKAEISLIMSNYSVEVDKNDLIGFKEEVQEAFQEKINR